MLERNYKRRFVLIFSHCFLDEFMLMELANIPTARDSPDRWKYSENIASHHEAIGFDGGRAVCLGQLPTSFGTRSGQWIAIFFLRVGQQVLKGKSSPILARLNHVLNWDLFIKFSPTFFSLEKCWTWFEFLIAYSWKPRLKSAWDVARRKSTRK